MAGKIIHDLIAGNDHGLEEELNCMRNKAEKLAARTVDVSIEVENVELHPGKKRRREVDHWLTSAEELNIKTQRIEEEAKQGAHFNSRRLRAQIVKITKEIEELLEEQAKFHNGLTIDATSSSLPLMTTELKGQLFEQNLRMIKSWLMDDEVSTIGVYGVGGVGKTTLAMHAHNDYLLEDDGGVYWVTVSKECTIFQLQHKIAKVFGVSHLLEQADEIKRPAIISDAIKRRRKVVLILDDLWDYFPLEKIGLPVNEAEFKLLLTTRSLDVCRKMACVKSMKVEPLSKEEAWSLFRDKLGKFDELPCEVKKTAKLVSKECGGLPLGVISVSSSMRGVVDVYEWSNTLEELKKSTRIHESMENQVFPSLELSYSRLNNVKLQNCFLSCALLFPEDCYISRERVIDVWIMEGIMEEELISLQEQLNMAHTMLNRLINSSLLELVGSYIKMHDLVRDMAIYITRKRDDHHVMVKAGEQLREMPCLTEELTKVSLLKNEISEIPPGMMTLNCPHLSILLLGHNPLTIIPDSFFLHLKGLKFLDLSWTSIEMLPNSVSCLENLSVLNLRGCLRLIYVPSLSKLAKLRHLYLGWCGEIEFLSQGIEKVTDFDGSGCNFRVSFSELISGLSNLLCLELGYVVNDIQAKDMEKLESLEKLCCQIHDIGNFNRYVKSQHFRRLTFYQLLVGRRAYEWFIIRSYTRKILIEGCRLDGRARNETPLLPRNLQDLEVTSCDFNVTSLVDALPSLCNLASLTILSIFGCQGIEYIWSVSSRYTLELKSLEKLTLANLNCFKAQLLPIALPSLEILVVEDCPSVEKLFASCIGQLCNLQEIRIESCAGLEVIFDSTMIVELPQLRVLSLRNLPKLTNICRVALLCKFIEEFTVIDCAALKKLPLVHNPTSLRKIFVEEDWWESLEWDYLGIKHVLQPFVQFPPS